MEQVHLYIKRIIAVLLAAFITRSVMMIQGSYLILQEAPSIIVAIAFTAGFLVLSILNYKITGEKPDYLYGLRKSDDFVNSKGGFWLLFKWILSLFGFIYDIVVWTVYGVYVLFLIFIDVLILIKNIIYGVIYAIIWFLNLFVPPIIFIYRIFIYYLIRWPWWIYKLTVRNMGISVNRNFYFISLWGVVPAVFVLLLFLGVGILVNYTAIVIIGAVFAILPLVWSYGEISALRFEDRVDDEYKSVRKKFKSGFDAVRSVLSYFVVLLVLIIAEICLNFLGWLPGLGFTLLGISLNINTFISLVLLFVFVILVFSNFMMPAHVVHHSEHESNLAGSIRFLGVIGKKFLRYILAHIPGSVFAGILSVIPALLVFLAVMMTLQVKDTVIDNRISTLREKLTTVSSVDKFVLDTRIERLEYYKDFPQRIFGDFTGLKERIKRKDALEKNILASETEVIMNEKIFREDIDSLKNRINVLSSKNDSLSIQRLARLEMNLENKQKDFLTWKNNRYFNIAGLKADLKDEKSMIIQLPFVFLLVILWVSFFGGITFAVIISYLGNIYHELYTFHEDQKPAYFRQVLDKINSEDRNQPLLGFTLIILIATVILLFVDLGGDSLIKGLF